MTIREMAPRIIAGLIALGYLALLTMARGGPAVVSCAVYLVMPLACIWFPEAIGDYVGGGSQGFITSASPDWLISLIGWFLLLLPAMLPFIVKLIFLICG